MNPQTEGTPATELLSVKSRWRDIGPDLAAKWLEKNQRNRRVSEDTVNSYALDMSAGRWLPTHQGIAFNADGDLIDGQHRLHAIIKSGRTVRMMVTTGLPTQVKGSLMTCMDVVDRGKTRSISDQLKVQHGIPNGNVIAALVSNIVYVCCGTRTRKLTVGAVLDVWDLFKDPITIVIDRQNKKAHGLKRAGVMAAFAFAAAAWPGALDHFTALQNGEVENLPPALQSLHAFLTSDDAILLARGNDRALMEMTLSALWSSMQELGDFTLNATDTTGVHGFCSLLPETVAKIQKLFAVTEGVTA